MILGFDTSNYTTSLSALENGEYINIRRILEVKEGQRGLRQSEALFLHIKKLPELYHELCGKIDTEKVKAAGVSIKPRNAEGSYMPVFLAGEAFASAVSDSLRIPLYRFSHQDGHIMAGIISSGNMQLMKSPFLSVHLSGGTTEILRSEYNGYGFDNEIIGGTLDISAGQLIDRVGVKMGMRFPCGRSMDELAQTAEKEIRLPVCVKDSYINFSGAETKAASMLTENNRAEIARGVIAAAASALGQALNQCIRSTGIKTVLLAGGVASNAYLRSYIDTHINGEAHFASVQLSADNAVGTAALAEYASENEKR